MRLSKILAVILVLAFFAAHACAFSEKAGGAGEPEDNCSAVYVGKDASADGTTIIARCADTHPTTVLIHLSITEASDVPERIVTGKNANLRTWRIHSLLAPSTAGDYETYRKYDLVYAPDHKVSEADVIDIFRDRSSNQIMETALRQTDETINDLIWYIMEDTDTLRYEFSYTELELSAEPYERSPFMPLVDAAEYAGFYGWAEAKSQEGLLLTGEGTTIRIIPSDGRRTAKGSLTISGGESQEVKAIQRNGRIYIAFDTAMEYLKR